MEACDTNHAGSTGNKTGIGRTQSPDVSPLHSACPVHRLILPCPLSHHNQMLFKTRSAAVYGIEAYLVDVEVNISTGGNGQFLIVGLPDTAVRGARKRGIAAGWNKRFRSPYQ